MRARTDLPPAPARPIRQRRRPPAALALVIAWIALPWRVALCAALAAAACAFGMGWLAQRQIGGQTGDVLGGAEQLAETAILLLLAATLG